MHIRKSRWAGADPPGRRACARRYSAQLTYREIRASRTRRAITDHGLGSVNHGFHGLGTDWHGLASGTDSTDWARTQHASAEATSTILVYPIT